MSKSKKPNKKTGKVPEKQKKFRGLNLDSQDWKYILGVLVLTLIAFLPAFTADFVNWDDDYNIANNNNTALLNWDNIVNIFSQHVIGNYNPLPILLSPLNANSSAWIRLFITSITSSFTWFVSSFATGFYGSSI